MFVAVSDRRVFTALLVALVGLAWMSLWLWGETPYGRFLSHAELSDADISQGFALGVVYVAGWTLMTVAMMLPTSLPLILLFDRFVQDRPNRVRLVTLLLLGYLGTWSLFGLIIHQLDGGLHRGVESIGWLDANAWVIGAATLMLAGVYQFTPLKYSCLDKCRSPLSFVMGHWHGEHEQVEALRLGVHHGLFCVGCCWSLMLLMFGFGVGNIGWMLVLGAVMGVEKNMPWGRRISMPLGVALMGWGVAEALRSTLAR
jgi:predicted metal-binding membrane protein